jgi:hypothetical protein
MGGRVKGIQDERRFALYVLWKLVAQTVNGFTRLGFGDNRLQTVGLWPHNQSPPAASS